MNAVLGGDRRILLGNELVVARNELVLGNQTGDKQAKLGESLCMNCGKSAGE